MKLELSWVVLWCVCVQPRVADLYSLDKDELQDMLDPLKQRVNNMENEARDTLDKVSTAPSVSG